MDKKRPKLCRSRWKGECYPIEIIGKDEKETGEFICLYCHRPCKAKKKRGGREVKEMAELIKGLIPPKRSKEYAYKMGKDCAKNGANTTNCHFSIFSSRENTDAWERGKEESK